MTVHFGHYFNFLHGLERSVLVQPRYVNLFNYIGLVGYDGSRFVRLFNSGSHVNAKCLFSLPVLLQEFRVIQLDPTSVFFREDC